MNLINDVLIKAGIITDMAREQTGIQWFKDITPIGFVATYIIPILFFLSIAIVLKARYVRRRQRDEITLRPFLNLDPPMAPV